MMLQMALVCFRATLTHFVVSKNHKKPWKIGFRRTLSHILHVWIWCLRWLWSALGQHSHSLWLSKKIWINEKSVFVELSQTFCVSHAVWGECRGGRLSCRRLLCELKTVSDKCISMWLLGIYVQSACVIVAASLVFHFVSEQWVFAVEFQCSGLAYVVEAYMFEMYMLLCECSLFSVPWHASLC